MSKIDFKLVSTIRATTGAALHTCKRALEEAKGNVQAAVDIVKKMGYAVAEKKADRDTSAGYIVGKTQQTLSGVLQGGLLECQSETDFVSTNQIFLDFANQTLDIAMKAGAKSLDKILDLPFDQKQTVEQARQGLVGQVGENVRITRYQLLESTNNLGSYVHKGNYGCMVELKGANATIAKDIAVHVVVSHPQSIEELLKQDFYKDPSKTVAAYLKENQAEVLNYVYFVLGATNAAK